MKLDRILIDTGILVAFYDLLVALSERLDIPKIATLDSDFDIYRRYRNQPFDRVFYPHRS
jgi:predicted nucleic acid-binding protein